MSATAVMPAPMKAPSPMPEPPRKRESCAKDGDLVYWRTAPDDDRNQRLATVVDAGHFSATVMIFANGGSTRPQPYYHFDCHRADYIKANPMKVFPSSGCFVPYYSVHGTNEKVDAQNARIDQIELAFKAFAAQLTPLLGLNLKGKDLAALIAKSEEKPS